MGTTRLTIIVCILISQTIHAGTWKRVDSETIEFSGMIGMGEHKKFGRVMDAKVKRIIVNSPGGQLDEALKIGRVIKAQGLDVHVDGECLSACANYFFLAAKNKFLEGKVNIRGAERALKGAVCFHGGGSEYAVERANRHLESKGLPTVKAKNYLDMREQAKEFYLGEAKRGEPWEIFGITIRTEADFHRWVNWELKGMRDTDDFIAEIGVDKRILTLDIESGNDWVCPSSSGLSKLQVPGVHGESQAYNKEILPLYGTWLAFTGEFPEESSSCSTDLKRLKSEGRCTQESPIVCLRNNSLFLSGSCKTDLGVKSESGRTQDQTHYPAGPTR